MTRDEALARADLPDLLDRIGASRGLQRRGRREFPCPNAAHEQTGVSPPCSVDQAERVWHCHSCDAGGSALDALLAAGWARDIADALAQLGVSKDEPQQQQSGRPEAEYVYHDADGTPIFKVVRFPGKRFRQAAYKDGRWVWSMDGVTRQLYRLPEVLQAVKEGRFVFVCEGEKDVESVRATGRCATTNVGGAGKWEDQYGEALRDAKVVVVADDDPPGHQHAALVMQRLYGRFTNEVHLRLPAEGCKDITEHLIARRPFANVRDLRPLEQQVTPLPSKSDGTRMALTAAVFAARAGSDKALEILGPMFQRGMRTVIGAQTGEGKTTLALQAVRCAIEGEAFLGEERWRAKRNGTRALVIDLEQGEETLKARLKESGLDASDRVDILWEPSGIAIDKREEDRAMVEDILREGKYDLVVLDPLYQSHLGSGNDEQVASAVMRYVDDWARRFNCALIIPMHARKPSVDSPRKFTKHDIAGSTTWLRNAEFVLGLQMRSSGFSQLYFFKDRIGRGPEIGKWWGLDFSREKGFNRDFAENRQARDKLAREALSAEDGVTSEELAVIIGVASDDQVGQKRLNALLGKAFKKDDRYRLEAWDVQTTIFDETGRE